MIEKKDSYGFRISLFTCFVLLMSLVMISCGGNPETEELGIHGVKELNNGWLLQASAKCEQKGAVVSTAGFKAAGWYKTSVPATVLAALVKNGVYKDIYFSKNLEKIPTEQFKQSLRYRKEFPMEKTAE